MIEKLEIETDANLFLTGFSGSGKSTVGELLAEKLERKFYDLDSAIGEYHSAGVDEIIEKFGIEYFRKIENQQLAMLCSYKSAVIALGGGTLINELNHRQVQKSGRLIYLMAPESIIVGRLKKSSKRPLFKNLDHKTYGDLFEQRIGGYLKAELCIETGDLAPDRVCSRILSQVKILEPKQ